jgi:hypothetical protein
MAATWKFDVTLLDLTGYSSDGALLYRDDDDRLVVRIHSSSESGLYDDFYVQEPRSTELQSTDGGLSWEPCEGQFPLPGVVTSSGKRVYIWNELLKGDRLWEHLDTEGIGHLYRPGAHMMHRLYRGENVPTWRRGASFCSMRSMDWSRRCPRSSCSNRRMTGRPGLNGRSRKRRRLRGFADGTNVGGLSWGMGRCSGRSTVCESVGT